MHVRLAQHGILHCSLTFLCKKGTRGLFSMGSCIVHSHVCVKTKHIYICIYVFFLGGGGQDFLLARATSICTRQAACCLNASCMPSWVVEVFGDEAPAVMFTADVFVYINLSFQGRLFCDPTGKMTEKDVVLVEADVLKLLLAKMRRLWRAVPGKARNKHVRAMKELLTQTCQAWEANALDGPKISFLNRCRAPSEDPTCSAICNVS